MEPEDVNNELAELGTRAVDRHPSTSFLAPCESLARAVLAAVLPEHEKKVREQVAREIEKVENEEGDGSSWDGGMGRAASIARGGS
jgi:hypothetical protein